MTSIGVPVVAGLAVGIALIVVFAASFKPALTLSDEQVRLRLSKLPEVQAFYEIAWIYIALTSEQFRHEGNVYYADYVAVAGITHDGYPATSREDMIAYKEFLLHITTDGFGDIVTELECISDSPIYGKGRIIFHATAEEIRDEQCLDSADPRFLPSKLPYLSDPNVLDVAGQLPEVLAFREKYPAAIEIIWHEDTSDHVEYLVERIRSGEPDSPIKESEALHLLIRFDEDGQTNLEYQCGGEVITENVLDSIKTTECPA